MSSVSQGSIFGALLFVLYTNDIPKTLSCSSEMFADDTLYYIFRERSVWHENSVLPCWNLFLHPSFFFSSFNINK